MTESFQTSAGFTGSWQLRAVSANTAASAVAALAAAGLLLVKTSTHFSLLRPAWLLIGAAEPRAAYLDH